MDYRLEQLRFELREDPSSRIFFKLGEHLRREGELEEAIEVLRNGLKQHPRYVAAWVSLGRAQLEGGDAEGARDSLERALQLDPENAVAARAMGEAAIVTGDWVTAVKALKRARGLSPRDDALDERIAFVEARLAELGLLKKPAADARQAPVEEPSEEPEETGEEPFAVRSGGDTGEWNQTDDVFAAGWVKEEGSEERNQNEDGAEEAPTDETAETDDDSGAYAEPSPLSDADVASMVGVDEPSEAEEPMVVVHEEEPAAEVAATAESAFVAPEPEDISEPSSEPALEPPPLPDSWPDPEAETGPELEKGTDGLPLPTMTLARLAIDQGDLDLAERTLRGVLEKEPGHSEASELLETLIAGPPEEDPKAAPKDSSDARAEALQRWLDAVRLASERLKT